MKISQILDILFKGEADRFTDRLIRGTNETREDLGFWLGWLAEGRSNKMKTELWIWQHEVIGDAR